MNDVSVKGFLTGHTVTVIITGGVSSYKILHVVRFLHKNGAIVRCALSSSACEFITPLLLRSLTGGEVATELFDAQKPMDHIRLTEGASLVFVAPATADFLAKMVHGRADGLPEALLLASSAPIVVAPAMNPNMWAHASTKRNVAQLRADGVCVLPPQTGVMACGTEGAGRLPEPEVLNETLSALLEIPAFPVRDLEGYSALVTAGPTQAFWDCMRFLSNASSGRQGYAIARHLALRGAKTILVSGPVNLPLPLDVDGLMVTTAEDMWKEISQRNPLDVVVCAAAVADFEAKNLRKDKICKTKEPFPPPLVKARDILQTLGNLHVKEGRPSLLIGFAAESSKTHEILHKSMTRKKQNKKCDWIIGNKIGEKGVVGKRNTQLHLLTEKNDKARTWPFMSKDRAAYLLTEKIAKHLRAHHPRKTFPPSPVL